MGSSQASWFIKNRVVYVKNIGKLTANDFRGVDQQIIALMREAEAVGSTKVHVLVDSTELSELPNLLDLEGGRILKYLRDPVCAWTVVVGHRNNVLLQILSRLLTSVAGAKFYMAHSMDQGVRLLRQVDSFRDDEIPAFGSETGTQA